MAARGLPSASSLAKVWKYPQSQPLILLRALEQKKFLLESAARSPLILRILLNHGDEVLAARDQNLEPVVVKALGQQPEQALLLASLPSVI